MEKIILENPWIIIVLALWMIPWKGWALWKSARNGQHAWFVVLLIVNSLAVLEIIYILFFSGKKPKKEDIQVAPSQKIKVLHNLHRPKMTL